MKISASPGLCPGFLVVGLFVFFWEVKIRIVGRLGNKARELQLVATVVFIT